MKEAEGVEVAWICCAITGDTIPAAAKPRIHVDTLRMMIGKNFTEDSNIPGFLETEFLSDSEKWGLIFKLYDISDLVNKGSPRIACQGASGIR